MTNWLNSAKRCLGYGALPKELEGDFGRDVVEAMLRPVLILLGVVVMLEGIMIVSAVVRPIKPSAWQIRQTYMALYLILGLVSLEGLVFLKSREEALRERPILFERAAAGYFLFIACWASFASAFAHRNTPDISIFTYVVLSCAVVMPIRPLYALGILAANQIVFLALLPRYLGPGVSTYASVVNTVFASCLGFFVSYILHNHRLNAYLQRRTIVEQNEKIWAINAQLEKMLIRDDLLSIHNRRYIEQTLPGELEKARAAERESSLLLLGIDHFKQYNDRYGHEAGDLCLQKLAFLIQRNIDADARFARYESEVFVVFLPDSDEKRAFAVAERIRTQVEAERILHASASQGILTISIGLCHVPSGSAASCGQLLRYADEALYTAKREGRNTTRVYQGTAVIV